MLKPDKWVRKRIDKLEVHNNDRSIKRTKKENRQLQKEGKNE